MTNSQDYVISSNTQRPSTSDVNSHIPAVQIPCELINEQNATPRLKRFPVKSDPEIIAPGQNSCRRLATNITDRRAQFDQSFRSQAELRERHRPSLGEEAKWKNR